MAISDAALKEIDKLKREILEKEEILKNEKNIFEQRLKDGLGQQILDDLSSPPKPNLLLKWKVKLARWKKISRENKMRK